MKRILMLLAITALAMDVMATEPLRDITLDTAEAGRYGEDGVLTLEANPDNPLQRLLELPQPGVTRPVYAIRGMVRHDGVTTDAYLQMDNQFDGKGTYFSKSLAPGGPMRPLSGTSGWREFVLPFYANTGNQAEDPPLTPDRLTLSIYLPDAGTVYLRNLELVQYADGEDPLRMAGQWFSGSTMGIIGGVGGSVIGIWGALIGFLAGRGKARGFAMASSNVLIVVGIVCLFAGVVALATRQPYTVWFTMFLFGGLLVGVVGSLRRVLPQRYQALELKKMRSMDA